MRRKFESMFYNVHYFKNFIRCARFSPGKISFYMQALQTVSLWSRYSKKIYYKVIFFTHSSKSDVWLWLIYHINLKYCSNLFNELNKPLIVFIYDDAIYIEGIHISTG